MAVIKISDLEEFCEKALVKEGMDSRNAAIAAQVLAQTDAFGTSSHGTKNLHNYIKKARAGGVSLRANPHIVREGSGFVLIDGDNGLGMVSSVMAMELACKKAKDNGIAIATVKNSCHFGAAGYYANIAARNGMIGLAMSNVDPNMGIPGARGKIIGNSPFSFAAPSRQVPSVFLDVAMSTVASLKVIQYKKDGKTVPDTWLTDAQGLPTTDPSHYPEEGAMQPVGAHKGYGFAFMVELLTGILAGADTSTSGRIPSWCFDLEHPNNVTHTFIAINPALFLGEEAIADRVETMATSLRNAPKAKNATRIFTPGEIEWDRYAKAMDTGLELLPDVEASLRGLAEDTGLELKLQ